MPIVEETLSKSTRLEIRDQTVFSFAHVHYHICLRNNRCWQGRFNQVPEIHNRYQVEYPDQHNEDWQPLLSKEQYDGVKLEENKNYMIHWTRGTNGPWKGESEADYFNALTEHNTGNPRNGYHTLIQIILTKMLRGSGKMIKGGEPVISFTNTNFTNVFKLIQYRNTLGHWNFESYGIGFHKALLKSIGARSVSYGKKEKYLELSEEDKPYFQYSAITADPNRKKISSYWSIEGEWRILGDLDFASIIQEAIFIVPTKFEADNLFTTVGEYLSLKRENFHYLSEQLDR